MKIRLGLMESNQRYTDKLSAFFNAHYSSEIQIFTFSSYETLENFLKDKRIDVLLADPVLLPENARLPESIALAYFADAQDVESIRDTRAVCRYQKADLIFKEVLDLFSELDKKVVYSGGESETNVILFKGAAGGVGTSTAAIACAVSLASAGRNVLYLNLQENGVNAPMLEGEGIATLSDVLYAIKSRSANISLKLESMVRRDATGVCFYEPYSVVLDARESVKDNIVTFVDSLLRSGSYEYLVIDVDPVTRDYTDYLYSKARQYFIVSDGTEIANSKLVREVFSLSLTDDKSDRRLLARTAVLYSIFGSGSSEVELTPQIPVFGHIMKYSGGTTKQVMEQIAASGIFASLAKDAPEGVPEQAGEMP